MWISVNKPVHLTVHSQDLSPSDYCLLKYWKKHLNGCPFSSDRDIEADVFFHGCKSRKTRSQLLPGQNIINPNTELERLY